MSTGKKHFNIRVDTVISNLTTATILGILNTSILVAFAALIFAGNCPDYFATGIAFFLLAGCLGSISLSIFSSSPGVIACIQDVPAAISGLMAVSLSGMLAGSGQETIFANIFIAIALSTLLTGISFIFLGYFKLGNLVRFIPYPVMGGFLAGTGWILFKAGLEVSTGVAFNLQQAGSFFSQISYLQLGCGVVFAGWLLALSRLFAAKIYLMPVSILFGILVFFGTTALLSISITELEQQGWLLGPLQKDALWRSVTFPAFETINWAALSAQFGSILSIALLSAISFLLGASALELILNRDLKLNKDLQSTGIVNLLTSVFGVPASYLIISDTSLAIHMGAYNRFSGIFLGLFIAVVFFLGGQFLGYIPNFVAGGIILFIGLLLLMEWLIDARKSFPLIDYLIVICILLTIEFIGFLEGVGTGLIVSVIIFAIRYSAINLVKNVGDGNNFRSSKGRPIPDQRLLDYYAHKSLILQLQGFIFFGTANSLYETIRNYIAAAEPKPRYLVLDMRLILGIDSSAVKSFEKILRLLKKKRVDLLLVNLADRLKKRLQTGGLPGQAYERLHHMPTLDDALEYCEDKIVESEMGTGKRELHKVKQMKNELIKVVYNDVMAALEHQIMFENLVKKLRPYFQEITVVAGEHLFRHKDSSRDLFFIIRGMVNLISESRRGIASRVQTLGPWTVTGEAGAFSEYHSPYSAVVVKEGLVYRLSEKKRKQMEIENPELASEFHRLIIIVLSNQLIKINRAIVEFIN